MWSNTEQFMQRQHSDNNATSICIFARYCSIVSLLKVCSDVSGAEWKAANTFLKPQYKQGVYYVTNARVGIQSSNNRLHLGRSAVNIYCEHWLKVQAQTLTEHNGIWSTIHMYTHVCTLYPSNSQSGISTSSSVCSLKQTLLSVCPSVLQPKCQNAIKATSHDHCHNHHHHPLLSHLHHLCHLLHIPQQDYHHSSTYLSKIRDKTSLYLMSSLTYSWNSNIFAH